MSNIKIEITRKGWIIKGVVLNSEKIFTESGGTFVQVFSTSSSVVTVPIICAKNNEEQIEMKIITAQGIDSASFHTIIMQTIKIKKFHMFLLNIEPKFEVDEECHVKSKVQMPIEQE